MKEKRISGGTEGLMYGVALIFDGISFIPVVGSIVPVIASPTFWLWFRMKGVDFNSTKKIAATSATFLVEVIPVINALPAWIFSTFIIIQIIKAEDLIALQKREKESHEKNRRVAKGEVARDEAERAMYEQQYFARVSEEMNSENEEAERAIIEAENNPNQLEERRNIPERVRTISAIDYQVNPHLGSHESQKDRIKTVGNETKIK